MRTLIVDDIVGNRRLLRAQLESEGHDILEAADGIEALELLRRESIDAIVSDILMPQMDGFRFCQEVRKDAKLQALPVLLYTSTYDSPGDRALAESVGADAYLIKPAPTAAILEALSDAAQRASQRAATQAPLPDDKYVLQQYNAALVRKLETRNAELQGLTRELEARVEERTVELREANRELESFAHSVSHDLRAPLRHITGFAEILSESAGDRLDHAQRNYLGRIVDAAQRMDELIQALFEFARSGRAELRMTEVRLDEVLDEALEAVKADTRDRRIDWRHSPLPVAAGDPVLIKQVFVNLLGNAIKYSRTRNPAVIETGYDPNAADPAIYVRDNGVGFDMKYADRLFTVFGRLHRQDQFEGTGIGLANAHRIVARHGGRIWGDSGPDGGATFFVFLPTFRRVAPKRR